MFAQIEITTKCNFRCFYCAGRHMRQTHMSMALFERILRQLPDGRYTVSLQGEGEPMVHPDFWEMVERVEAAGKVPYTITNGSLMDVSRVERHFPVIGISLDTVDLAETERIGRKPIIDELDRLLLTVSPPRVIVHTVDYGQPLEPLRAYLRERGIARHMVQPLQKKDDYSRHYLSHSSDDEPKYHYRCRFLNGVDARFWNIDGVQAPCCFIKDMTLLEELGVMKAKLARRVVPNACRGCGEIMIDTLRGRPAIS